MINRFGFGPVVLHSFGGGGSSGGGGGTSGQVSYPAYLQTFHGELLDDTTADALTVSMVDAINAATGSSPYSGVSAFDPATPLAAMDTAIAAVNTFVDALNFQNDWETAVTQGKNKFDAVVDKGLVLKTANPVANLEIDGDFDYTTPSGPADIDGSFVAPTPDAADDIGAAFRTPTPAVEDEIAASVTAFEAVIDDRLTNTTLPRFKAGLRDINAVQSSSFTLGQAIIEGMQDRDVADYQGKLRIAAILEKDKILATSDNSFNTLLAAAYMQDDKLIGDDRSLENKMISDAHMLEDKIKADNDDSKNKLIGAAYMQNDVLITTNLDKNNVLDVNLETDRRSFISNATDKMLSNLLQRVDFERMVTHYTIEANRLEIVAEKEQDDRDLEIDEADAKWDLELFSYPGNLMASINGGTYVPKDKSKSSSALGGALSGAAAGAAVGSAIPGVGTALGAIIGGLAGLVL